MYCVHCGQALPQGAKFCSRCGSAQPAEVSGALPMTTEAPSGVSSAPPLTAAPNTVPQPLYAPPSSAPYPAPYAPPNAAPQQMPPLAPTYAAAPAPYPPGYPAGPAPVVVVMHHAKSASAAGLLEFLWAGAGMLYAGQIATGIFVMAGTIIANIVWYVIWVALLNQATSDSYYSPDGGSGDLSAALAVIVIGALLSLAWGVFRIIWAVNMARNANRRATNAFTAPAMAGMPLAAIAGQPYGMPVTTTDKNDSDLINKSRMIWVVVAVTVAAATLSLIIVLFVYHSFDFTRLTLPFVLVGTGFWASQVSLSRGGGREAAVLPVLTNVVLAMLLAIGLGLWFPNYFFRFSDVIMGAAIWAVVCAGIGFGFTLALADWARVRAACPPMPRRPLMVGAITAGVVYFLLFDLGRMLFPAFEELILGMIATAVISTVAVMITARWLRAHAAVPAQAEVHAYGESH